MELFETTGTVEVAEILFEGTRSKGAGVVQFTQVEEAETAIGENMPNRPVSCQALLTLSSLIYSQVPGVCIWRPSSRSVHHHNLPHLRA